MAMSMKRSHEQQQQQQQDDPDPLIVMLQPQQSQSFTLQNHLLDFITSPAAFGVTDKTSIFWEYDQHPSTQNPHPPQVVSLLTTTVATGIADDFEGVAMLTVIFSILGAILLGYETSRIVSSSSS